MNRGLSFELKAAFTNISLMNRPILKNQKIQYSNLVAGFISVEGYFRINIQISPHYSQGY